MKYNLDKLGQAARIASKILANATTLQKNQALHAIAQILLEQEHTILASNQKDLDAALQQNLAAPFIDRLKITDQSIKAMSHSLETIANLPDPIGTVLSRWTQPNGLEISRIRVPLGVIGVIYESRPNVTIDAGALCLKSGNAAILRCGSESFASSQALLDCMQKGLLMAGLPAECVQMVPSPDRTLVNELLHMDKYIDVIIPRGGPALIERVSQESRIPLFKHLAGLCHTYIHTQANPEMANTILLNAKMRRTGICGATETLLIDRAIAPSLLPNLIQTLQSAGCEIRGDQEVKKIVPQVIAATEQDWSTEYLDAILAVKIVADINEAIEHIARYGTQHTEAIITEDHAAAEKFLQEVDSAIVLHNASTQFADGGEFGMGAEIGIATGKLHARGPVGVEQLTTFKYQVRGHGQIRPK